MKIIKKTQVVPIDINYGKIINSFNTSDDKTKNAPSINAVEEKLNTVNDRLDTAENEILELKGTVLFNDTTLAGSTDLTLSDFPSNYAKLEIFWRDGWCNGSITLDPSMIANTRESQYGLFTIDHTSTFMSSGSTPEPQFEYNSCFFRLVNKRIFKHTQYTRFFVNGYNNPTTNYLYTNNIDTKIYKVMGYK